MTELGVLEVDAGALGTARISYRIDANRFEAHALLYLPLDTLRATLETVASQEDLLAALFVVLSKEVV